MHAIIMRNIADSSGEYRRIQVYLEKTEYVPPPPFELPGLMQELLAWYRAHNRTLHPFELALVLHTKFVAIHPFTDGNGRLGRALLNFVLSRNGYPRLYLDLSHREQYLDAVAQGNEGDYQPIVALLREIYVEQHRTIFEEIIEKILKGATDEFPEHKRMMVEFSKIKS